MKKSNRKQKTHGDKWKWKHNGQKSLKCNESISKRDVYSNAGLPQKQQKSHFNNLHLKLKELEKEEQIKPKVSRRNELISSEYQSGNKWNRD